MNEIPWDVRQRVRDIALDIAVQTPIPCIDLGVIAERADVDPTIVEEIYPDDITMLRQLLNPFWDAMEGVIMNLTITAHPNPTQQRAVIAALVDSSLRHRRECFIASRMVTAQREEAFGTRPWDLVRQAGIRLKGADYTDEPSEFLPTFFALVCVTYFPISWPIEVDAHPHRDVIIEMIMRMLGQVSDLPTSKG